MGPAGQEVRASVGAPVMFVEIFYDYQPFMFASFIGNKRIEYSAAFTVRDARDTSNIFNPAPAATVNACGSNPPPPPDDDDGNNGHGNNPGGYDPSNPGGGGGGGGGG